MGLLRMGEDGRFGTQKRRELLDDLGTTHMLSPQIYSAEWEQTESLRSFWRFISICIRQSIGSNSKY